jgi:hypothetical protein
MIVIWLIWYDCGAKFRSENFVPTKIASPKFPHWPSFKNYKVFVIHDFQLNLNILVILGRLPLWSSGQSSWLQIRSSGFDFRRYQIFWKVVGLERGPLSLVSTIEELLGRKNSCSSIESQEYGRRDPSRLPRDTFYTQKLSLTSLTRSGRSVGIVRSRTQATEFSF